jgi:hypothetical protein
MEAACWDGYGGGDDTFCLMSSSTARSVAMFRAICSCWAASCSTPRRTISRLDAKGSSCCTGSGAVAATAGDFVVEMENNQPSNGARATTMSLAASPWDCHASVAPIPMRTAKQAASGDVLGQVLDRDAGPRAPDVGLAEHRPY